MSDVDDDLAAAVILDGATSVLDEDDIPNVNQSPSCFSCKTRLRGLHCHNCGQKNDDYRRSLLSLGIEALGNITAFDARIWRTWALLLTRPGRIPRQYADGQRTKWTSPVRAYLAMSILLFGYIAFTGTQMVSLIMDVDHEGSDEIAIQDLKPSQLDIDLELHFFETENSLEKERQQTDLELVNFLLGYDETLEMRWVNGEFKLTESSWEPEDGDAVSVVNINGQGVTREQLDNGDLIPDLIDDIVQATEDGSEVDTETPPTPAQSAERDDTTTDVGTDDESSITDDDSEPMISLNGNEMSAEDVNARGIAAFKLFLARPQVFNDFLATYLPRIMFFMMPFTMLLGALFIRGRGNALLYDHVVHAAYIHAVFFFLLLVGLILSQLTPIPANWLLALLSLYMLLYLPISLRVMFSRGMIKTIWTTYMVGAIYFVVIAVALITLTTMAIIDIVEQTGAIQIMPESGS